MARQDPGLLPVMPKKIRLKERTPKQHIKKPMDGWAPYGGRPEVPVFLTITLSTYETLPSSTALKLPHLGPCALLDAFVKNPQH